MLALDVPMDGGRVPALEVAPADAFAVWQRLHEHRDDLGGVPVALMSWEGSPVTGEDLFNRWFYGEDEANGPRDVLEGARRLTTAEAWAAWAYEGDHSFHDEDEPTEAPDASYLEPFAPREHDAVVVAILPVDAPEESLAYHSFYGADGLGRHEQLIAIARGWRERFGAMLWANWGTMLQFVVERPPEDPDACLALAREHERVAPSTLILPGVTIGRHARVLRGRTTWFLHERP